MTLRVRDARGYDPPLPRMRYWRLWRQGGNHQNLDAPLTVGSTGPAAQRLLRLLSVHTYVSATGAVARDPAAQPRAFVPATVRRVAGEPQAMAALFAAGFVPGRDAVVEGAAPAAARGRVDIARDDDARVDLRARLDRGGLVVLTDQLDRGW